MRQRLGGLNVCSLTRLAWPALLVAVAVSTMTGSDATGGLAAAVTVGVLYIWGRVRGTDATCAVSFGEPASEERPAPGTGADTGLPRPTEPVP